MRSKNKNMTISLRCTENEYYRITNNAKKQNKSISAYLLDSNISQRNIKSWKRKQLPSIIAMQQSLNELKEYIQDHPDIDNQIKKSIENMGNEVIKLWEC